MYNFEKREKIIWILVFFGFTLVISTEILSYFNILERKIFFSLWAIIYSAVFFLFLKINKNKETINFKEYFFTDKFKLFCLLSIVVILFFTLIISLIYPPNTPDSLSYHMPRIMQWIQNESIDFYPTSDTRQLIIAPFAELVIMHFILITNSDVLANLVQWFSMAVCIFNVSLITKRLGGNLNSQLISSLFCATIPMGILQSTGTQTDYVVSMWITSLAYFLIVYLKDGLSMHIYGFAASLSLAILTKQTTYIFALPFCIWLTFYVLKSKPKHFRHLLVLPLIILVLNFGHYMRTYKTFGNPLSSGNMGATNEIINFQSISSNIIRNILLNLTVPSKKINTITRNFGENVHSLIKIKTNDKRTTYGGDYYTYFTLKETLASNTLHFLIIIFVCLILILMQKKIHQKKTFHYAICLGSCFLLFSIILKWQPWGNRLLLPFFVLSSPIVGLVLSKMKNKFFFVTISLLMVLYSLPYLLMNDTRPLVARITQDENYNIEIKKPYFWIKKREDLYSTGKEPGFDQPLKQVSKFIKKIKCNSVGLITRKNSYEYLYWIFHQNKVGTKPKMYHLNVQNQSSKYHNETKTDNLCVIIVWPSPLFYKNGNLIEDGRIESKIINKFKNQKKYGDYVLFF